MPRKRAQAQTNQGSDNAEPPRQRIQFAYNADVDSPTGVLFQYLIKSDRSRSREGKHKGIDAMSAFWKPFAYQEKDNLSPSELQAIARESVELLSRQMALICDTFDLEPPTSTAPTSQLQQEIRQAVTDAFQKLVADGMIATVAPNIPITVPPTIASPASSHGVEEAEGVDFDEDVLLGSLLEDATIAA